MSYCYYVVDAVEVIVIASVVVVVVVAVAVGVRVYLSYLWYVHSSRSALFCRSCRRLRQNLGKSKEFV